MCPKQPQLFEAPWEWFIHRSLADARAGVLGGKNPSTCLDRISSFIEMRTKLSAKKFIDKSFQNQEITNICQ
jgi:hypothetical protein